MIIRKWILKIHLYGGLLCFWYLIIFGISSLHYHHHFSFMEDDPNAGTREEKSITVPDNSDNSAFAEAIRDSLGIPGWHLFWKTYWDQAGIFHTEIQNSRAGYFISYDKNTSTAVIHRNPKSFWSITNSLHGFAGNMPNGPLMIFWTYFTYVCLFSVIFSIITGIWLWTRRSTDKLIGWITVLGIMAISISLMVIVYIKG